MRELKKVYIQYWGHSLVELTQEQVDIVMGGGSKKVEVLPRDESIEDLCAEVKSGDEDGRSEV